MTQATQGGSSSQASSFNLPDNHLVVLHAVILTGAFGIAMPLAVILLRISRFGFKPHWILQSLALGASLVGLAIAIYMSAKSTAFGHFDAAHQILGILIVTLLLPQAFLGRAHHVQFRRTKRRALVSYLHLWSGRAVIALGMLNAIL